MDNIILKIAMDFSRTPGVRYKNEGEFSGEEFRNSCLRPKLAQALSNHVKLIVDLDGTAGLGTSFLEESFGGLIREDGFEYKTLQENIEFVSNENPDYIDEVNEYLKDAYEKKGK